MLAGGFSAFLGIFVHVLRAISYYGLDFDRFLFFGYIFVEPIFPGSPVNFSLYKIDFYT